MNAEGFRLCRAFLKSPFGDERWVFCDWLEEQGATSLAAAIRWAGANRKHPRWEVQFSSYEWWDERCVGGRVDPHLPPGWQFHLPSRTHDNLCSKDVKERRLLVRAFKRLAQALEKGDSPT